LSAKWRVKKPETPVKRGVVREFADSGRDLSPFKAGKKKKKKKSPP